MSSRRASTLLLWSLVPTGAVVSIGFMILAIVMPGDPPSIIMAIWFLSMLWFVGALCVGIGWKWILSFMRQRHFREAQRYGEMNSWQPISSASWQRVRGEVVFKIVPSYGSEQSILSTQHHGETVTIPEYFDRPLWAMRFADYLFEYLTRDGSEPQPITETALAIISSQVRQSNR